MIYCCENAFKDFIGGLLTNITDGGTFGPPSQPKNWVEKFIERGKVTKDSGYNKAGNKFFNETKLREDITVLIQEMLDVLSEVPLISQIEGAKGVYNVVKAVSFSCTAAVVAYKGFKLLFSPDDSNRPVAKNLFTRMAYGLTLGSISMQLIDLLISFCNLVNRILRANFTLGYAGTGFKSSGILLPMLILVAEMLSAIRIIIGFWMRMAELVFSGVISPAIFTLWINEEWSGYLKQWWRRVSVLVFTQTAQILMLVIYGMLINGLALSGTLQGALLSIALLLSIGETPRLISQFCDASSSNLTNVKKAYRGVRRFSNKTKAKVAKNAARKLIKPEE